MSQSGKSSPRSSTGSRPESGVTTPRKGGETLGDKCGSPEHGMGTCRKDTLKGVGFADGMKDASKTQEFKKGYSSAEGKAQDGLIRSLTSALFGTPIGFFKSRADLRTWGEQSLTDPSVQPYKRPPVATPFHTSLPGYSQKACEPLRRELAGRPAPFYTLAPKGGFVYNPHHPSMDFARVEIQRPLFTGEIKPPMYDWKELNEYKMMNLPYPNALMLPTSPSPIYVPGNYLVSYPYGVPAVEENEAWIAPSLPKNRRCRFLC
ncbi:hypothetical protein BESB_084360 [Besnoitia besnoiti]|uniref:Inner membrane complex protein 24 n=1 Tax=Besnoitia besnoiti TaxID=94643 RepID=A0A2A9MCA0_BESBE|nr:hypothetical protein BESB_084360 [Besnoitia besnoiti]PFH33237.1 hypothetical protein BESB_084360 [Besnoitia besnoiti]